MERVVLFQSILLCVSRIPRKISPDKKISPFSRSPLERSIPSIFPKTGSLWERTPALFYMSFRVPRKGAPPSRFPTQRSHTDRRTLSRAHLHLSRKVPGQWTPLGSPTGPLWRKITISRAFLHISVRFPRKAAPPSKFPNRAPIERDTPFPEPYFIYLSQSPVNEPHSRFLNGAFMERDTRFQSLLLHISW